VSESIHPANCYNPVRNEHMKCPQDWPHISFHRLAAEGRYRNGWCCRCGGVMFEAPPEFAAIAQAAVE
jgi:hypothetical protein